MLICSGHAVSAHESLTDPDGRHNDSQPGRLVALLCGLEDPAAVC